MLRYPAAGMRSVRPPGSRHGGERAPPGSAGTLRCREPHPVFVLEKAVVEGVYPSRRASTAACVCGRAMPASTPSGSGCTRSSCLTPRATSWTQPSAFRSTIRPGRAAVGRIIELHPAGLGNTAAEQAALVQALRRGTPLTTKQKESIAPSAAISSRFTGSCRPAAGTRKTCSPCLQSSARRTPVGTLVAVAALEQVGLITAARTGRGKVLGARACHRQEKPCRRAHPEMSGGTIKMPEERNLSSPRPQHRLRRRGRYSAKTHLHQPMRCTETATVAATALPANARRGLCPRRCGRRS